MARWANDKETCWFGSISKAFLVQAVPSSLQNGCPNVILVLQRSPKGYLCIGAKTKMENLSRVCVKWSISSVLSRLQGGWAHGFLGKARQSCLWTQRAAVTLHFQNSDLLKQTFLLFLLLGTLLYFFGLRAFVGVYFLPSSNSQSAHTVNSLAFETHEILSTLCCTRYNLSDSRANWHTFSGQNSDVQQREVPRLGFWGMMLVRKPLPYDADTQCLWSL